MKTLQAFEFDLLEYDDNSKKISLRCKAWIDDKRWFPIWVPTTKSSVLKRPVGTSYNITFNAPTKIPIRGKLYDCKTIWFKLLDYDENTREVSVEIEFSKISGAYGEIFGAMPIKKIHIGMAYMLKLDGLVEIESEPDDDWETTRFN